MSRRSLLIGLAAVVAGILVVLVGRWEGTRNAARQNAEMQVVLNKVGPLAANLPTGYRVGPPDCLAYPLPDNVLGLEVCFDSEGRVVETADRSGPQPVYASLAYDPSKATIKEPRVLVDRLLHLAEKHSG